MEKRIKIKNIIKSNDSEKLIVFKAASLKDIIAWYHGYKMYKEMQGMDKWEQYVATRDADNASQKYCFALALIRLLAVIMADNVEEGMFYKAKNDVLSYEIINKPNMREFKEWVEKIDHNETDYSKIQELLDNLTKQNN